MTVTNHGIVASTELSDASHGATVGADVLNLTLTESVAAGNLLVVVTIQGYVWPDFLASPKSLNFTSVVDNAGGGGNVYYDFGPSLTDAIPGPYYTQLLQSGYFAESPATQQDGYQIQVYYCIPDNSLSIGDIVTVTSTDTFNYFAGYVWKFSTDKLFTLSVPLIAGVSSYYQFPSARNGEQGFDGSIIYGYNGAIHTSPLASHIYANLGLLDGEQLIALTILNGADADRVDGVVTQIPATVVQDGDDIQDFSGFWTPDYYKDVGTGVINTDTGFVYRFWTMTYNSAHAENVIADFRSNPYRRDDIDGRSPPGAVIYLQIHEDPPIGSSGIISMNMVL
jgi:hypothetical protein